MQVGSGLFEDLNLGIMLVRFGFDFWFFRAQNPFDVWFGFNNRKNVLCGVSVSMSFKKKEAIMNKKLNALKNQAQKFVF